MHTLFEKSFLDNFTSWPATPPSQAGCQAIELLALKIFGTSCKMARGYFQGIGKYMAKVHKDNVRILFGEEIVLQRPGQTQSISGKT